MRVYESWSDFLDRRPPGRLPAFSAHAQRSYTKAGYAEDDLLVFGSETRGLSEAIRTEFANTLYTIPMQGKQVRSLNLSSAAAIVLYEALRQLGKV